MEQTPYEQGETYRQERKEKLGFLPQKELIFNKLLPYNDGIDDESQIFLSAIKANLSKAVIQRELRPGCVTWSGRLTRYIHLYGLKFSKEDHLQFIKLFYELTLIPNLEATLISVFANVLVSLLRKQHLISPDELQLPWRPLYSMVQRILDSPYEPLGLFLVPSGMDSVLRDLIVKCRDYFPLDATSEMLTEWRPLLCPFDMTMLKATGLLETFLPTKLEPNNHHKGFGLWLEELQGLWKMAHNQPQWESDFMVLFSRLSENNIGYVDWEPLIPFIFSKILNNFGLPVGYRQNRSQIGHKYELGSVVTWIVSNLGGNSKSCQNYLSALFKTIESYYHPSNIGTWNTRLNEFLRRLPTAFVKRLHRERSNKKSWLPSVPESHRLTEKDIDAFVESILPVALLAMFSRVGAYEASIAFHQLAQLRPGLVIPPILDRLYSALETVTEPHRLTATLQCIVSVVRPLVRGGEDYPEGPTHVVPLLMACLPAIDPNDIRKTLVTFQLVTTIATLVPIFDCSTASEHHTDLTEIEKDVCSTTAGFEDFVLHFIDRCFNLVESSSLEQTRMDKGRSTEKMTREETLLEIGLSSTVASLLMQCSAEIFDVALNKLHSFVCGRTFEPHVAGKFVAHICCSVTKVNPAKVLKLFLPRLLRSLDSILSHDDVLVEELLEDELLFNLLLLSELVRCPGNFLLPYSEQLMKILDRALLLKARLGYQYGGSVLNNLLKSLTTIYPTDYHSIAEGFDRTLAEYLPIRDWGKPGDVNNLQMKWHLPSSDERLFAEQLLLRYLATNLKKLDDHVDQTKILPREELAKILSHVLDSVLGSGAVLPPWQEEPINVVQSAVTLTLPLKFSHSDAESWHISFRNGQQIRLTIAQTLSKLVRRLLSTDDDDTKALFSVISCYQILLFYYGVLKDDFETHQKNFQMVKRILGSNLIGRKMDIRAMLVDRAQLQHELRVLESSFTLSVVTPTMKMILKDLVQLATSQYSEVRSRAQAVISLLHRQSPLVYKVVMEDLMLGLKPGASHEHLKGILYILAERSSKQRSLLVIHDWETVATLWPAIISAPPSEKPSIIHLLDSINSLLYRTLETTSIFVTFTDECIFIAQSLSVTGVDKEALALARLREADRSKKNEKFYYLLIQSLTSLLNSGTLHWRLYNLGVSMLSLQLRYDLPFPSDSIAVFSKNLISDAIIVRKIAIKAMAAIFKQQKRKHVKIVVDPQEVSLRFGTANKLDSESFKGPGDRRDNSWMQYQSDRRPMTVDEWNQPRFVHKTHYGFYTWPIPMEVYAPENQQPVLDRPLEELSLGEAEIANFFSVSTNVDKLIYFLSLEDRKGKDKFDATRFSFFKGLFRNFGDQFLSHFRPQLEKLVVDQHEASQRCAAEIITGLIRGSKHWNFCKTNELWDFLCPLLRKAFNHVNVESINDWGTAIATASENRDPNRIHWLMELIMEEPLRFNERSFVDSSRLYMLQGGISQQEWRCSELLYRLLKILQPNLDHPYQNVRDRLGSVLTNIFLHDIQLPNGATSSSPRVDIFVAEILPKLEIILIDGDSSVNMDAVEINEDERNTALRLLKTISQWLAGMWSRTYGCQPDIQLLFIPYLCCHESSDSDKELARECSLALSFMAKTVMRPSALETALKTVYKVAQNGTWKARIASLEFLQVFTFSNLFNITHLPNGVDGVMRTVLLLLADARLEVREKASQVLSGLLHCDFLNNLEQDKLLKRFTSQVSRKLPRNLRTRTNLLDMDMALIVERHAGVLGLCSFVNAYPYDVPEFLPDVLVQLGNFLNDPQPIPVTVKKTLSNFRRTHHDNWQFHKLKFSDDQLVTLTDLLVSPNYYA